MPQLIHRLALAALAVVAAQSVYWAARAPIGSAYERALQPVFAVALWSFLFWKLLQKPRKWGLGLGILFLVMIVLQTYFWTRVMNDPDLKAKGFDTSWTSFILSEIPLAVAAILCLTLRWHGPPDPVKGPPAGQT